MAWRLTKGLVIILMILVGFILLLLLPREMKITHVHFNVFTADFPFNMEIYKENISQFIQTIKTERGFGKTNTGVPIVQEVQTLLSRSLLIIIPSLLISMILGTFLGTLQFYFREKVWGKLISVFSWLFSSIPDFFLFIAFQYLLIKLMNAGLTRFSLYGQDHWYSFIIPLIAITLFPLVHMAKFISMSLEKEMSQEYVRTSYAKGLVSIQVLARMLKNCLSGLLNQTQVVMVYILTGLPIIEKLSSYRGAGYQLLQSILGNEDRRALAHMIPFLIIMLVVLLLAESIKRWLLPHQIGGESK
ncbi:ABC transporter permease subunit [Neobacillus sp. D3-1R]|uniref:ABC transporter permease subunit n=1 Tax=Neobacillus sp. D3-1R TaxID=3445778 RepID=UPI003FA0CE53